MSIRAALISAASLLSASAMQTQPVQGPKYGHSYYYTVVGTSSTEPDRERPWSEPFETPGAAAERLAEVRRDHSPGGLLESSPDKPRGLRIRKSPRWDAPSTRPAEDVSKAARDRAEKHRSRYEKDEKGTKCNLFVRDMARELLGRALPELEGRANEQYDKLKRSLDVETLWSPDGRKADLDSAKELLENARSLSNELAVAKKENDLDRAAGLQPRLDEARSRARDALAPLAQAFESAQMLADRGEPVVIAWNDASGGPGHVAFVVPSAEAFSDEVKMKPSGDWAGMRVPWIAQAGKTVAPQIPMSEGFRSVESVENLAIFVLPNK
jgi:hypothetical protein